MGGRVRSQQGRAWVNKRTGACHFLGLSWRQMRLKVGGSGSKAGNSSDRAG